MSNQIESMRHIRFPIGEKQGGAKLSNQQATEIIKRCNVIALSKEFGVSVRTIMDIVLGRSWKHLEQGESDCSPVQDDLCENEL